VIGIQYVLVVALIDRPLVEEDLQSDMSFPEGDLVRLVRADQRYRTAASFILERTDIAPPQQRHATFLYMNRPVGVAELRQNLSRYLRRVEQGERLLVTDRNRPVAELGPPPSTGGALDRLIAAGKVARPVRRGLPGSLPMEGDPYALTRALDEIRGER